MTSALAAVRTDLECRKGGDSWMIYNNKAQKWIGTGKTGAGSSERCEQYLETLSQNAVCTYADDGFRAYNADSGLPL